MAAGLCRSARLCTQFVSRKAFRRSLPLHRTGSASFFSLSSTELSGKCLCFIVFWPTRSGSLSETSTSRFFWTSSCYNTDSKTPFTYEDIPELIRKSLQDKNQSADLIESQLRVLDKLIQVKREKGEDSEGPVKELTPEQVYELAVAVLGTQDTVGMDAVELSVPLFRTAAMAGSTDGKYTYAKLLQMGQGVEQDPVEAGAMFSELAEKGHPFAQFSLAQMYYSGHGVKQDFELALSLFEVSAQNGICQAYSLMGDMYMNGQGVTEDEVKAADAYKKGAECGDVRAMMCLAHCYSHGTGVKQDNNKVFDCHRAAAEQGHPTAQHNLGTQYFCGRGVEADMTKAAHFFALAADQGFELAQINLGNMYFNGLGVERDLQKAKELYSKAAKTNKNAQLLLQELESEAEHT